MMKFVYLICAILAVGAFPDERPRVFCGRALAEARILYCFGPEIAVGVKRNFYGDARTVHTRKRTPTWPWLARRIHKRAPGLVDECCLKPCYVNQLLSYC
ncbi:unnamed protein product, partial [Brenthis ino]